MSTSIKTLLAIAATGFLANSAMAADGTVNFTGEIIAASCAISAGGGTSVGGKTGSQTIDVKLGKVSSDSLAGTAGGGIVAGKAINLTLDCGKTAAGLTSVALQFDPNAGSGVDSKNISLLKTTGTSAGVGIGLYDDSNKLLNLSANDTIKAALVGDATAGYTAKLGLRAAYVSNGQDIKVGTANGTLPFTLTYE